MAYLNSTTSDRSSRSGWQAGGRQARAPRAETWDALASATLSKAHIRPQEMPSATWWEGSSVLRVSRGGHCDQVGGGLRGHIKGFSNNSRRRLLTRIGQVRRDAPLPLFITLTWPKIFPSVQEGKRQFNTWVKRMRRAHPRIGMIWKIEPQQRGAPHYHLLAWGVAWEEICADVPNTWYEIAGGGDGLHWKWHMGLLDNGNRHCVQPVRSWKGVWAYAAKYLGKTFEVPGWGAIGRYWGVINPGQIPFGQERRSLVSRSTACNLQRYQRRYAHLRHYRGRSVMTYCDAEQWVTKLIGQGRSVLDTECLAQSP
jgi:hypothetical protein